MRGRNPCHLENNQLHYIKDKRVQIWLMHYPILKDSLQVLTLDCIRDGLVKMDHIRWKIIVARAEEEGEKSAKNTRPLGIDK